LPFPWENRPLPEPRSLPYPFGGSGSDPQILWRSQKLESLGLLAGGVAHDFNNSLLAILGNADLLERDLPVDSFHRVLVSEIRAAAERAGDLCNQLQAFAGKGQMRIKPVDLSATARGMVRMLKVGISRKVNLCLELDGDLPLVPTDDSQIHQLVMNLVVNAAEAIGDRPGSITLRTGVLASSECCFDQFVNAPRSTAGTFVYLAVSDSGPGMDPLTLARAFDPFFSTKPHGRGLGLASVLGIVRSHGGCVGVMSDGGSGTTVTVLFPCQETSESTPGQTPGLATPGHGGSILVVDDEEYVRALSARMLGRLGYTVHLAADGQQALEFCRQRGAELDCVLLDLIMPVMDGVDVHAALRQAYPDLKVLLTSGYHEREVSRRFGDRGLAGFLQKPYDLAVLGHKLNEVLNERPVAARPPAD
jgi:CheY-like chemotaxis protein